MQNSTSNAYSSSSSITSHGSSESESESNATTNNRPLKHAYLFWRFLDGGEINSHSTSRKELLIKYPSEIFQNARFTHETGNQDEYNFEQWKLQYLQSLNVTNENTQQHTIANNFSKNNDEILFLNFENNIHQNTPPTITPTSASIKRQLFINRNNKNEHNITIKNATAYDHSKDIELNILQQTENYIQALNALSNEIIEEQQNKNIHNLNCIEHKTTNRLKSDNNDFQTKLNLLTTLPSTKDLLKEIEKFEKNLENEAEEKRKYNSVQKSTETDIDEDENESTDDWNNSRSPSPVIIWKPSSRVQIATDLPSKLKSIYVKGSASTAINPTAQSANNMSIIEEEYSDISYLELQGIKPVQSSIDYNSYENIKNRKFIEAEQKWNSNHPQSNKSSKYSSNKINIKKKVQYGQWYIPPHKWRVKKEGEKCKQQKKGKRNAELDEKEKHLKNVLPQLFISKMYKDYIINHENTDKRNLPSYLLNIGTKDNNSNDKNE